MYLCRILLKTSIFTTMTVYYIRNRKSLIHENVLAIRKRIKLSHYYLQQNQAISMLYDGIYLIECFSYYFCYRFYMQGVNLEMADYDKRTALHLAASEGHVELVKFLINVVKVKHDPKDR